MGPKVVCRVQRRRNAGVLATTRSSTRELSNSVKDRPLTSATAQIAVKILLHLLLHQRPQNPRSCDNGGAHPYLDTCRNCLSPSMDGYLSIDCRKVYLRPFLTELLARSGLRSCRLEARTKAWCGRLTCLPSTASQPSRSEVRTPSSSQRRPSTLIRNPVSCQLRVQHDSLCLGQLCLSSNRLTSVGVHRPSTQSGWGHDVDTSRTALKRSSSHGLTTVGVQCDGLTSLLATRCLIPSPEGDGLAAASPTWWMESWRASPHWNKKRCVGQSQVSDNDPRFVRETALHKPRTTLHFVLGSDNAALNVRG